MSFTLTLGTIQQTQAQIDHSCTVKIVGGPPGISPKMYPGQHAAFSAKANVSEGIPRSYTWQVDGPIIKEYDDDTYRSDNLSASQNLEDPTYMLPGDFRQENIQFYWRPNTTDLNRTITVSVQTSDGTMCKDSRSYIVERNYDDIDLQAEDFYVEKNHPDPLTANTTKVLKQHENWHRYYTFYQPSYIDNGDTFFDFHRLYIAHFDAWRKLFGYDNITAWDPGTTLPVGIDINHTNRGLTYISDPLPSWFKHYPRGEGPAYRPPTTYGTLFSEEDLDSLRALPPDEFKAFLNQRDEAGRKVLQEDFPQDIDAEEFINRPIPCERMNAPSNSSQYPKQQNALIDFEPDQELLGCALTQPYHNERHGVIGQGGDMSFPATAPIDPIFWRLHKFLDRVSVNRAFPQTTSGAMFFIVPPAPSPDLIAPRVFSQNPFRLNQYITGLPLISEKEKDLFGVSNLPAISAEFNEPVIGVKATDFVVNGSPATEVNGTGAGPYVFIGFESPGIGPVNVTFSPGNITDRSGNQFEGDSWKYIIIDPNVDKDQDGLKDELEADLVFTNPAVADTDGDTIPDGLEAVNPCLNPLDNDAHVMNMSGVIVNETGRDADKDGVTNVQEFRQGTDPCLPPERKKTQLDENIGLQGILPLFQLTTERLQPFAILIKTTGGLVGVNNTLSYDSFTGEAVSNTNGNETRRQISSSDENLAMRALNNSGFFEAASFYPPPTNITDYLEFTMFAILGNELHAVYWTDASEEVPEAVQNLPYALANILGGGSEYQQRQQTS